MEMRCPVCGETLSLTAKSYLCRNRHTFDLSASGYTNLSRRPNISGDNAEMAAARYRFLQKDHYRFLKEKIRETAVSCGAAHCVDLACGEGYYTSVLPGERIGVDLSSASLRKAAKRDPEGRYFLASIFSLPLFDAESDFVLTCFAPRADAEIFRILQEGGSFLFVLPAADHLWELKEVLYPSVYPNKDQPQTPEGFTLVKHELISESSLLQKEELQDLFLMTPYAYHTPREAKEKLFALEELRVRFSFSLYLYQKSSSTGSSLTGSAEVLSSQGQAEV
ncbi:MAG: methyltransferase domain-containing protein [Erysipelotrichaceae bacterium]|nr:methyltransferase domain-containing protein [Erysipelotrichaceae bacterium]